MKPLVLVCVILCGLSASAGTQQIGAANVVWNEVFGSSSSQPHTTFCLMASGARGAVRPMRKNVQSVVDAWLMKHPDAQVVPVYSWRDNKTDPQGIRTFVWVVDGEENLNVELVRQGCFPFLTQGVPEEPLQVSKADYLAVMTKMLAAEEYATANKLGIFSGR